MKTIYKQKINVAVTYSVTIYFEKKTITKSTAIVCDASIDLESFRTKSSPDLITTLR